MANSNKKVRKLVSRKTKEQLMLELAETQVDLKQRTTQLADCSKALRSAKADTKELENQLAEFHEKSPIPAMASEDTDDDLSSPKATASFVIHFYPSEGHYTGTIRESVTQKRRKFHGVDHATITQFISEFIPIAEDRQVKDFSAEPAMETHDAMQKKEIASRELSHNKAAPKVTPKKPPVLREIELRQFRHALQPGRELRAYLPFTLQASLHFPVIPTTKELTIDNSTYDVHALATDVKGEKLLARNVVSSDLLYGIRDYDNEIHMSGLAPGVYTLRVRTIARFGDIDESRDIELRVC